MKQLLRIGVAVLLWFTLSLLMSYFWFRHPESFPEIPQSLWHWLDGFYKSSNAEEVADMELLTIFSLSSIASLMYALAAWGLYRWMFKKSGASQRP